MRLAPLLLAAALLVPTVAATAYAGVVREGEARMHRFDNQRDDMECIQLATWWTVTLTYQPASDVLTLSAAGRTVTGQNGVATVGFAAGVCTEFDIHVTGTSVGTAAAYAVAVASHAPGGAVLEWG